MLAAIALAACTFGMLAVRPMLEEVHVALILLLVVLGASAAGGRALGLAVAALSFVVFDLFFLPPYNTLRVANPLNWLVLVAFLATSIVAAQLLYRSQEEARAARDRAAEIDRLATLGAETLNVARAADALQAIAEVIRSSTNVDSCEILTPSAGGLTVMARATRSAAAVSTQTSSHAAQWVSEHGRAALEKSDAMMPLRADRPDAAELELLADAGALVLLLPLHVRGRAVGVLRVAQASGLRLNQQQWRFVDVISYYGALGVERVRLESEAEHAAALREADRLKDALLASVSHDLRTPLTTIKAMAHDLRTLGDERSEIIEQEADRLNRFVSDLLDLSRLSAGALPLRIELNAVDDLLGALVQRVEPSLGAKRLEVMLPPGDALLVGRFDFVQALRALANFVENAGKYDKSAAPIEVTACREGAEVAVRVSDRGPGVPPEAVSRLFEPFRVPNGVAPDAARRAGLGLSIARQVAEAQGGRVAYAPRPGGGSIFTLYLPAAEDMAEATTPARAPATR